MMTTSKMTTSKMTTSKMTTSKSNKFDRRVSLLMDCGVIKDKNWPDKEVKKGQDYF